MSPLRLRNRPWPHALAGGVSLLCGLVGVVAPELTLLQRLALGVVFGGMGLLVLTLARQRWTALEVGDRVRWRRPGLRLELDRSAARRVLIVRTARPLRSPTDYALVVELGGQEVPLLFAEHWLWGGLARRRAERLAERLGVPVEDPGRAALTR